jgi:hypothetical protein
VLKVALNAILITMRLESNEYVGFLSVIRTLFNVNILCNTVVLSTHMYYNISQGLGVL